jgi:L-ascorbate metabolism protein UlaG (beta-lactamase superfamily)
LLPIDGFYTMTPEDATKAAIEIAPKHMIPMHMKPGMLMGLSPSDEGDRPDGDADEAERQYRSRSRGMKHG